MIAKIENLWSWIISLANAKSQFKIIFCHKNVIPWAVFKIFACSITTNWDLNPDEKIFFMSLNSQKFSQKIQYQRPGLTH